MKQFIYQVNDVIESEVQLAECVSIQFALISAAVGTIGPKIKEKITKRF